ncbi:MAG TPA: ABC transporter permease [Thermoanaerobaculia bacterium]
MSLGRKALRDLWVERARSALVVLAISLGITAFTTVLSAYAVLTRELDRGYLATDPASASIRIERIDESLMRAVAADPRIAAAERRRAVVGRLQAGPAEWRNLTLFVVEDFGNVRVGKLKPEKGSWPPREGEILIERDAFSVARAQIGDRVRVRTGRGGEHALLVSGSVHDVGRAQARMENVVYGYVTRDTLAGIGEDPYFDQLDILVAGNRNDPDYIRGVADGVRKIAERSGHPVRRVDVPTPGKHPHAAIMGLLLLAMSTFGLFALILSGVLVINLLAALMASQTRQIGVMKAIGGTRRQISRIYLSEALLLGAAGLFLALPAGAWGSRVLCRSMATFLNFDIASFAAPVWVGLAAAVVGIGIPLLAAVGPIVRGTRITVLEALNDFGIPRTFDATRLERRIADLGGENRPMRIAIRNGFRRRGRIAGTIVTLGLGGLFFMSGLNVRASLVRTLDRLFGSRKFDLSVGLTGMYPREKIEEASRRTFGVRRVEGWITTEASIAQSSLAPGVATRVDTSSEHGPHGSADNGAERFSVIALPDQYKMIELDIVAGRGLAPGEAGSIVVNTALAGRQPRIRVGQSITLAMGSGETTWRVVGIAREPFSPPAAYVTRSLFDQHGHAGMVNTVRLALDRTEPASIGRVRALLERELTAENVMVLGSLSKAESRYAFDQHLLMISVLLVVTSCLIGGVGGLGLATTMSLNVRERRREIAILRAIGAGPRAVGFIVVAEAIAIGLAGWMFAVITALPISRVIGNLLVRSLFSNGLDFRFEPAGPAIWLAVSVSVAIVASLVPAWNASRRPVAEALGYE